MTGTRVYSFGSNEVAESSSDKLGITACSQSADSTRFAFATESGTLQVYDSSSLKLTAVALTDQSDHRDLLMNGDTIVAYSESRISLYQMPGVRLAKETEDYVKTKFGEKALSKVKELELVGSSEVTNGIKSVVMTGDDAVVILTESGELL